MTGLERYAKRYSAQYEAHSFETVLVVIRRQHVLGWLGHYGARRVLEIGCGLEPLFAHYDGFTSWWIVEPIAEFARHARELAAGDSRVQVFEGRVQDESAALASGQFDFIVVSSLLHEVPDPKGLLDAVRSLCNNGTVVHFNVPNALSFHRLLAVEIGLIDDVSEASEMDRAFGHHTRFERTHFITFLERAGFRVTDSGTYFVKPFSNSQMDAILGTGAFPSSLIEGLDRMTRHMPELGCELFANARKA